jgi:hypothetical protein
MSKEAAREALKALHGLGGAACSMDQSVQIEGWVVREIQVRLPQRTVLLNGDVVEQGRAEGAVGGFWCIWGFREILIVNDWMSRPGSGASGDMRPQFWLQLGEKEPDPQLVMLCTVAASSTPASLSSACICGIRPKAPTSWSEPEAVTFQRDQKVA